jgi:hypothetical protein
LDQATSQHHPQRWAHEEQHVQALQPHGLDVKKSHARTLAACWRRNSRQLGPLRRGAGVSPAVSRSRRTVLGETRTPSFSSSPAIRG